MNEKDFYLKIDEAIGEEPGTVSGEESLSDSSTFDSMAMMEILVFLDEECGIETTPEKIVEHGTVKGLYQSLFPA